MRPTPAARRIGALALFAAAAQAVECKAPPPDEEADPRTETGEDIDVSDITSVELRPSRFSLDLETEIDFKASVLMNDGSYYDLAQVAFTSDAPGVAVVNSTTGHLVPVSVGTARITAEFEGIRSLPAEVTVVTPGSVEVTVVDATTGASVPFAFVAVGADPVIVQGMADQHGRVLLEGPLHGPLTVTAAAEGFDRTTVVGVASRTARIPLPPALDEDTARIEGTVTFAEEDQVAGSMAMALVMPVARQSPVFLWSRELIRPSRVLSGWGQEWLLPENLYVQGLTSDYRSEAPAGEGLIFAAGGVWDLAVMLELGNAMNSAGMGPVIETMSRHIDGMRFGMSGELDLPADAQVIAPTFAVDVPLTEEVDVDTPVPPEEYYFPDPVSVMAWRKVGDHGYVAVGFGSNEHPYIEPDPPEDDDSTLEARGPGVPAQPLGEPIQAEERLNVPVREIAREGVLDDVFEGVGSRYLAMVSEGGADGEGDRFRSTLVVSPPVFDSDVRLPAFLGLTAPTTPQPDDRTYHWVSDPEVDLERQVVWLREREAQRWWIFAPGGALEATIPEGLFEPFTKQVTDVDDMDLVMWSGESMALEIATFDSLMNVADEGPQDLEELVNRRVAWEVPDYPAYVP